ncbi:mRNA-decapping enzyme 1B isoform X3 [Periophthalmus magnuspinnatus]|uniref:mRNA-decapping enzyme 1B isoform X3 n=1 Tax=Periophthalmus magnuspinnatus TaxID=409849 RepID=UPI002436F07B|nr:mRNA-decapping enzyme 1B isoform X3 [Periophthalmus magnuspinnatus]
MRGSSAGSCLVSKGLDISLAALKRQDPYINTIVDVASQVALYTYNNRANEWEKTEVEGTLFIYTRLASPRHGFTIMNRLSMENLTEPITKDLDFQLQDPFLLYRNARLVIHGIWFYDKDDCQRVAQRMKFLTHQEQVLAQSQGGWLSPAGSEGKPVDIIQMLSKARNEYDKEKSSSEPKEIGGSSVLYGNPNLIKPIPVKPNTQENEGSLSLAALFGTQPKLSNPAPSSSSSSSNFAIMTSSTSKPNRPHVVRTLTYENTTRPGQNDNPGERPGVQKPKQDGGTRQADQSQHCPAIQKLMQGQRGTLQTVSESPENRLSDNGHHFVEHHQGFHQTPPHHLHHHHHHHHHHNVRQPQPVPPQLQPQTQLDAIKRLFQSQPPVAVAPQSFTVSRNPAVPQPAPVQPAPVQPAPVFSQHQNQPFVFSTSEEGQQNSHIAAHLTGFSGQMAGVVSPHELLQKLQIVQQEQSRASSDPPQPGPALAPRFMGPSHTDPRDPGLNQVPNQTTAGQKAALQFQVISPQRIPATVAPSMLLSPSVFSQTKPSPGPAQAPRPGPNPVQILSRSQLQATLLHLIQNDSSFLDSIYEAYTSRFSTDSCGRY